MQAITFLILSTMNLAYKSSVSLFPTVFILGDIKVHVGSINYSYVASDIEAPIYQHFYIQAVLEVPNCYNLEKCGQTFRVRVRTYS